MKYYSTVLSFIAIAMCVWVLVKISKVENNLLEVPEETEEAAQPEPVEETQAKIEVAEYMTRIHIYVNKLYFAGKLENKALYEFYLTEMKEVMEEVASANVMDEGINISENIRAFGIQSLQVMEKRIGEEGFKKFDEHYQNLVTSCNSCHKVSQKGFIVITVPVRPVLDNQDYRKGPDSDMKVDMDGD